MSVSTHRCPTCKSSSARTKNLAIFIDGTSNKPGVKNTNVVKLYQVASEGVGPELEQHKYYLEGIGGYDIDHSSPLGHVGKAIYRELEIALAWNVEKNVMKAYGWLARSYQEGDQIYLFGYSRGAYQVRALAGMIHEVGLLKEEDQERIKQAYRHYRSVDPNNPKTRNETIQFKQTFCRSVRIHFVGVWDTVSSLGLIKKDVHITASASVTNACHFRHALALDERRVKFMPEYFTEVNAHRIKIESRRSAHSNVDEVWFAGGHSDVGGARREHHEVISHSTEEDPHSFRVGNMPLLWMKREAINNGLFFDSIELLWDPEEADCYREMNHMRLRWRLVEILPIRHQVSFTGTGKHKSKLHLFHPRSVIPHQHIHSSILSGEVYTPSATLGHGIGIPTVPRITSDGLWETEPRNEVATMRSLTSLLRDPKTALEFLEMVLFLLGSYNGRPLVITSPQWSEEYIGKQSDFDKFAFSVIRDVTSNFSTSEELVEKARSSLKNILHYPDGLHFPRTLYVIRFLTSNETLRRRFIAHDVIEPLLHALQRTTECCSEKLFPLATEVLCYLINDDNQRVNVINQLAARLHATESGRTKLSLLLDVKLPSHLTASLKMIVSLVPYRPDLCEELRPRIRDLAKKESGLVGSVAVEALVALGELQITSDVPFSNILGYFDHTLPRLDAEVGDTSSYEDSYNLPHLLRVGGSGGLDGQVMHKLVRTIEMGGVHQRTLATLTLLKLCRYSIIRNYCLQSSVLNVFLRQLEHKETSLLAAYALTTCLTHGMCTSGHFDFYIAAQRIITMFRNGWFDDAVGQVEGSEIFRELMTSDVLRKQVVDVGIVNTIIKKFEAGECHAIRMGLICLDILEEKSSMDLETIVRMSLSYLRNDRKKTQMKGVKILSALALTVGGARAIEPHVTDIVTMLLPPPDGSPILRSQLFGPTATLHNLCKNEALRRRILESSEFSRFRRLRSNKIYYPKA